MKIYADPPAVYTPITDRTRTNPLKIGVVAAEWLEEFHP